MTPDFRIADTGQVEDLKAAAKPLRERGWNPDGTSFEILNGPCYVLDDPRGKRFRFVENIRPKAFERNSDWLFLEALQEDEHLVHSLDVVGPFRDHDSLAEDVGGLVPPPGFPQGLAQLPVGGGIIRIDADGPLERVDRVQVPQELGGFHAEEVVPKGIVRFLADGILQDADFFFGGRHGRSNRNRFPGP